jgi:hypothetical protein
MITAANQHRAEEILKGYLIPVSTIDKKVFQQLANRIASELEQAEERGAESLAQHLVDTWKETRR